MLKMKNATLAHASVEYLSRKQSDIDLEATYEDKVNKGKLLWNGKSRTQFSKIREKLEEMCVGKRRCNYCEDSVADEVEHIRPKDLYPSEVFCWENYLFSCGNCNGPKNNLFAVFVNGAFKEISRKPKDPILPPDVGNDVFLNPRVDDPINFIVLDLETMYFIPKPGIAERERCRARYTIDTLRLNARDFLVEARKEAMATYFDSLRIYVERKGNGASEEDLEKKKSEIESRQHPTVWVEMQRQRARIEELSVLFEQAPELIYTL